MDRETAAATREGNWSRELLPKKEKASRLLADEDEKGRGERREKKLEEIAALRSETSKENGAAIDRGVISRSLNVEFVVCSAGNAVGYSGFKFTCQEACAGKCCVGGRSCDGFTGGVAKDGSCNDFKACYKAEISVVSGGSCDGFEACSRAEIDVVSGGSCDGDFACEDTEIDVVSDGSCDGDRACRSAEIDVVSDGSCVGT